ncbi:MAG: site-specific integrase [Melioribacteraceae bacterium]|nr:site-specific integrase [Melioribacteraceae bacterium]
MKVSVKLRKKQNTPKTASLYLDINRPNYKRERLFLGLILTGNKIQDKITLETANEIRIQKLAALQRNAHDLPIESKIKLIALIEDIAKTKEKSNTRKLYETVKIKLNKFDENASSKRLSSITLNYLKEFETFLLNDEKEKVSKNTAIHYLNALKAVFNYATSKKLISVNPMKSYEIQRKDELEREYLTIAELKRLEAIENKNETLRAFLFASYTGLRLSDIKELAYKNIEDGKVKVKMRKTEKFISIPLSNKAKELVSTKILNHTGKVFNLPSDVSIGNHLKKIFKSVEIEKKKISFHLSRHTFATIALTIGIDILTISKLLGHRELKTTQIYTNLVDEKITKEMNKFNYI